jgi:hypothetical protein
MELEDPDTEATFITAVKRAVFSRQRVMVEAALSAQVSTMGTGRFAQRDMTFVQSCMEYVFHFTVAAKEQDDSTKPKPSKTKAVDGPQTTNFHHVPGDALYQGLFFEQYRCGLGEG